jgi:hypothetical protein
MSAKGGYYGLLKNYHDLTIDDSFDSVLSPSRVVKASSSNVDVMGIGTRIKMVSSIESMLMHPNVSGGQYGTIVRIKNASSDKNSFTVKWDNGPVEFVNKKYIEVAEDGEKGNFMRVASSQVIDFFKSSKVPGGIVHKSSQDLWAVNKTDDGDYVLERLFDSTSGFPLREQS